MIALRPWATGMKCLNNDEASLTWLVIRGTLWVDKRLFTVRLTVLPECIRCGDMEESISHAFFFTTRSCVLCTRSLVRMLNEKFFALEASSVCSNVMPPLNMSERYVFLCLLSNMRVVICTTQQKEFYHSEFFSSQMLVSFYTYQIKIKILSERKGLSFLGFGEK